MTHPTPHELVTAEVLLNYIVKFKKENHYYPSIRTCVEHFKQEGISGLRSTCTVKLRFDTLIANGDLVRPAPRSPIYYVPFLEERK